MSDQERAIALLNRWHADADAGDLVEWIAREFGAVRLEERLAIAEWLRANEPVMGRLRDCLVLANRIETGEHAGGES